jgi:hypothetical protein
MATDLIRYDLLVQDALRGVVRRVLEDTMREGLPGEHHYYVTFRTAAPGVRLSDRMRERYPDEMTIILQHQFWDLAVTEHAFEVGLSFSGIPERLRIPFDALTGFFDPSVEFVLKFEVQEPASEISANDAGVPVLVPAKPAAPAAAETSPKPKPQKEAKSMRGAGSEPAETPSRRDAKPTRAVGDVEQAKPARPAEAGSEPAAGDAKVVSIDSFRKKP